jgi:Ankyrin repeats (many copies)/Ankyrin repeats (3 copies)
MIIKQIAGVVAVCLYVPLWSAQEEIKRRFEHVVTEAEIINPTTPDGMLLQGIDKKRYSQVAKALELGAHVDARYPGEKLTALMGAVADHSNEPIALLLIHSKAGVNAHNERGLTPLMYACSRGSDVIVQSLFENKADINAIDFRKNAVFLYAVYHRKLAHVTKLIKYNCDVNIPMEFGNTSLITAAHQGHSDIVCVLLSCNANPFIKNKSGGLALEYAQDGLKNNLANEVDRLRFKQTVKVLEDFTKYSREIHAAARNPLTREEWHKIKKRVKPKKQKKLAQRMGNVPLVKLPENPDLRSIIADYLVIKEPAKVS